METHKDNPDSQGLKRSAIRDVSDAAMNGTVDDVRYFIEKTGAYVNAKDIDGWTLLHFAAWMNSDIEVLKYIVSQGAVVNIKDFFGMTALHCAASGNSNVDVLKYLIFKGANVDAKDKDGWTPLDLADTEEKKQILREAMLKPEKTLWIAATNGDWEIVEQLLERNPSLIHTSNDETTLLHLAICQDCNFDVLCYLLSKGVNANSKDADGWTPLLFAIWNCYGIEILKLLVSHGANVNEYDNDGWTPLHEAAYGDSAIEVLEFLISQGANLNVNDKDGKTPLDVASTEEKKCVLYNRELEKLIWNPARNGDWEIVKQRIEHDPSLIAAVGNIEISRGRYHGCNFRDSSLLHLAAMGTDIEILKYFVSKGIDVNVTNANGLTPLHVAALNRDYDEDVPNAEVLQYLVSQGADFTAIDIRGRTPLFYASEEQQKIILDPALETKEPEKQIWVAATYGYWDIVKQYLELDPLLIAVTGRASIDHFDHPYYYYDSGVSLVHLATYRSNIDLLKYLISHGANVNAKDAEGNTALHTAAEHVNSVEVIEYLISQGLDVNERNDNAPKVFFQRGFTPLHKAAWRNSSIEILKCLITHGADANAKDYNDKTPLDVADSEEKKRLLREAMSEPEEAVWKAATDGDWEAVKRWIEYDPSLSRTSDEAWVENEEFADITLLHLAVAEQDVDLLKYLISHGADVNAEDCDGITPLHCAIVETFNIEALKYLVSLGADVFEKDMDGKTALEIADTEEKKSILRKAMRKPEEAIWEAAEAGDWDVVKQWLERDPSLIDTTYNYDILYPSTCDDHENYEDEDYEQDEWDDWYAKLTLLHFAAINSDVDALKMLVSFGADVNAKAILLDAVNAPLFDEDGDLTALHLAVTNNATAEVAKYLISQGADINAEDFDGKTPLELLIEKGRNIHENNNE